MERMHAISLLKLLKLMCMCPLCYIVCLIKCLSILAIMGWDHQNLKVHVAQLQVSNNYGMFLCGQQSCICIVTLGLVG